MFADRPEPGERVRIPAARRVLMAVDAVGGVWRYALDLSAALRAQGTTTLLAVLGPPPSQADLEEAQRCCERVATLTCRLEWMEDPWDDVARSADWLLGLEEEWAPDVVHLNGYAHAALPWRAPAIVVAHSCVCSWWRAVNKVRAPEGWDEYRRRVADGLRQARLVIAPSAAMGRGLAEDYGSVANIRVIPNGRPEGAGASGAGSVKEPFVFAAGRLWDPAKNVHALCTAAASVRWPVYVGGAAALDGSRPPDLANVRHLGVLSPSQVQSWMARASIYALPARYEPFGLSVLEAAMAGCALVLGDIASLRENWAGAAVFVPPDDSAALAEAIERIIGDAAQRHTLGQRARERSGRFTSAGMASAYGAAYDEVQAAARGTCAALPGGFRFATRS